MMKIVGRLAQLDKELHVDEHRSWCSSSLDWFLSKSNVELAGLIERFASPKISRRRRIAWRETHHSIHQQRKSSSFLHSMKIVRTSNCSKERLSYGKQAKTNSWQSVCRCCCSPMICSVSWSISAWENCSFAFGERPCCREQRANFQGLAFALRVVARSTGQGWRRCSVTPSRRSAQSALPPTSSLPRNDWFRWSSNWFEQEATGGDGLLLQALEWSAVRLLSSLVNDNEKHKWAKELVQWSDSARATNTLLLRCLSTLIVKRRCWKSSALVKGVAHLFLCQGKSLLEKKIDTERRRSNSEKIFSATCLSLSARWNLWWKSSICQSVFFGQARRFDRWSKRCVWKWVEGWRKFDLLEEEQRQVSLFIQELTGKTFDQLNSITINFILPQLNANLSDFQWSLKLVNDQFRLVEHVGQCSSKALVTLTDSPIGTELDEQQYRPSCNWIALQTSLTERSVTKKQMKDLRFSPHNTPTFSMILQIHFVQSETPRSLSSRQQKDQSKNNWQRDLMPRATPSMSKIFFSSLAKNEVDSTLADQGKQLHLFIFCAIGALLLDEKRKHLFAMSETCLSPSPRFVRQSNLFVSVCWTSDLKSFFAYD